MRSGPTRRKFIGVQVCSECHCFRDSELAGFMARTQGPDGALLDYQIAYTFGVYPLQQYLIAFPGGAIRCLASPGTADRKIRAASAGSIFIPIKSCLRGTGCIGPVATRPGITSAPTAIRPNLQKNYNLAANTYATSSTTVDVACNACHGPGSRHVAWAKAQAEGGSYPSDANA
jgi:hypothetical protein